MEAGGLIAFEEIVLWERLQFSPAFEAESWSSQRAGFLYYIRVCPDITYRKAPSQKMKRQTCYILYGKTPKTRVGKTRLKKYQAEEGFVAESRNFIVPACARCRYLAVAANKYRSACRPLSQSQWGAVR